MSADDAPGPRFDAMAQLRFAITELGYLASALGSVVGADSEAASAAAWDTGTWRSVDLLERVYADIGSLSAKYMRIVVADKYGSPGGLDGI